MKINKGTDEHGGYTPKNTPRPCRVEIRGDTMRKQILALLVATAMACAFVPLVGAANSDVITVTLRPGGTMAIDVTLETNATADTWFVAASVGATGNTDEESGTIYNNGTVACTVAVVAAVTTDPNPWDLVANGSVGVDDMYIGINTATEHSLASPLDPAFTLAAKTGSDTFQLVVKMPTASSTSADQTLTVTFTGTAA